MGGRYLITGVQFSFIEITLKLIKKGELNEAIKVLKSLNNQLNNQFIGNSEEKVVDDVKYLKKTIFD